MIRHATLSDLPAVLGMVKDLHVSAKLALSVDDAATTATLRKLMALDDGLLLVVDGQGGPKGFLAATVGVSAISFAPIAMELGWWVGPEAKGAGLRLLILYERWAKLRGCHIARMSTPPGNVRAAQILEKRGFFLSEMAWGKVL